MAIDNFKASEIVKKKQSEPFQNKLWLKNLTKMAYVKLCCKKCSTVTYCRIVQIGKLSSTRPPSQRVGLTSSNLTIRVRIKDFFYKEKGWTKGGVVKEGGILHVDTTFS